MITYCINTILCSGYFIIIYLLLLEREKMHRFNRFYLLFSMVLSLVIPVVSFELKASPVEVGKVAEVVYSTGKTIKTTISDNTVLPSNNNLLPQVLIWCYATVSLILLIKFIRNVYLLLSKAWSAEMLPFHGARLVLLKDELVSYSFLNYIFIDKDKFEAGGIEKEILIHELTHVRQKHSLDIIVIELLKVFFWFNPFIYLYRNSVNLNHEFLADASVILSGNDVYTYQQLLLAKAGQRCKTVIVSPFDYIITKKRLTMINRKTSNSAWARKLSIFPVFGAAFAFFSINISAQEPAKHKVWPDAFPSTKEGAANDIMKEYKDLVAKYKSPGKEWWKGFEALTAADRSRLETLFMQMSKTQQDTQIVAFRKPLPPLKTVVPKPEQITKWKKEEIYGIWIDDKRVKNDILNNYTNTDFAHYFESRLMKNALNYGKHYFQVNLSTKAHFQHFNEKRMADTANVIMFRGFTFQN